MTTKEIQFPVYRKYKGINIWFKIINDRNFIEIKQLGQRFIVHELVAEQYSEMVLIQDMITCNEGRWEEVEAAVYAEIEAQIKD